MHINRILDYCKQQATIQRCDYDKDCYWRADKFERNKARLKCLELIRKHLLQEVFIIGTFYGTRFIIGEKSIEYTAGQYPATEIYWALLDALTCTVKERQREHST